MTWLAVARNDLRQSVRSTGTWTLTALFLVVLGGTAYALAELATPEFDVLLDVVELLVALLLPLVGVVVGYDAVVAERESGTLALLASLPNSRRDVVVGKVIARAAVLAGPLLVGSTGAGLVSAVQYPSFALVRYLGFVAVTFLYGLTFVGIATALSMALSSSRRVIGGAFGAYVVLVMFWNQLVDVLVVILFRFRPGALPDVPAWAEFLRFLDPRTAFVYLLGTWLDVGTTQPAMDLDSLWFTSRVAATAVLVAWVVVPVALGYVVFARSDV